MELAGQVTCMGARKGGYRVLTGKHERRRPLGRPRCRRKDNIKIMEIQKVGWRHGLD
jgi:hypothetical protein